MLVVILIIANGLIGGVQTVAFILTSLEVDKSIVGNWEKVGEKLIHMFKLFPTLLLPYFIISNCSFMVCEKKFRVRCGWLIGIS
jgi:hypothetical protein